MGLIVQPWSCGSSVSQAVPKYILHLGILDLFPTLLPTNFCQVTFFFNSKNLLSTNTWVLECGSIDFKRTQALIPSVTSVACSHLQKTELHSSRPSQQRLKWALWEAAQSSRCSSQALSRRHAGLLQMAADGWFMDVL